MRACSLLLKSIFFLFQHLSPATQGAIDQGVSFNVDPIHFLASPMTVLQSCLQGDELLTNAIFSDNNLFMYLCLLSQLQLPQDIPYKYHHIDALMSVTGSGYHHWDVY